LQIISKLFQGLFRIIIVTAGDRHKFSDLTFIIDLDITLATRQFIPFFDFLFFLERDRHNQIIEFELIVQKINAAPMALHVVQPEQKIHVVIIQNLYATGDL
jgi:hypothetical protein